MFSLHIGNRTFTKPDIINCETDIHPAVCFCRKWLQGNEFFTLQTSGSTGIPKQIQITRKQMLASAGMTIEALQLNNTDVALVCLNTQYIAGIMMLVRSLVADMQAIVVEPSSDPFMHVPNAEQVTFAAMVPLQISHLLSVYHTLPFHPKALLIGGASISTALDDQIGALKFPVYATYGMTETVSHIALRRLDGMYADEFFHPLKGISVKVNHHNCLQIKGEVTDNKWLSTNDICTISPNHAFKVVGRIDQVINTGGIKVQAEKIEATIEQIFTNAGIKNRFFVTGTPDEKLGETVTLIIEGDFSLHTEVLSSLSKQVSRFEMPRKIMLYKYFEETPTLKIDKKATVKNMPIHEFYF